MVILFSPRSSSSLVLSFFHYNESLVSSRSSPCLFESSSKQLTILQVFQEKNTSLSEPHLRPESEMDDDEEEDRSN